MTLQTLNPSRVKKQTTVHSVQFAFVLADQNGGTLNVSLTKTLKLEYISRQPDASSVTASQQ